MLEDHREGAACGPPGFAARVEWFEKRVRRWRGQDKRVRLMMSTPGVGPIVGLTYVAAIDDPGAG